MKILEALEKTGKAEFTCEFEYYAEIVGKDLFWFKKSNGKKDAMVAFYSIINDNWKPYHKIEETS